MLVSIGIPFLNAEATILDAVRSVFAQSYRDWELILLDDGSTDRSLEMATSILDPRVRVVSDGQIRGLQVRLNDIVLLARGEYVARMDADDLMHPDRLARQIGYLEGNRQVDVVGAAVYTIDGSNNVTGVRHTDIADSSPAGILRRGFICHPTATGRTEWFRRNRYDPSFAAAEDHELFCRTAGRSKLARLPTPLLYYREAHKDPRAYMRRYATHNYHIRRCYLRYGPSTVGLCGTVALLLQSWAKVGIYAVATAVGAQEAVIRRRSGNTLTQAERRRAEDGLVQVLQTPIPGVSPRLEAWRI